MRPYLRKDLRSVIFVVAFLTAGASIAYVVVTNPEPKIFWAMMINVFVCVSTGISVGIDIYKIPICFNKTIIRYRNNVQK